MIALLIVAAVGFLKKNLLNTDQSLAEPLLEEVAVETDPPEPPEPPEPPKPKPFEGTWKKEDGTIVQIEGDKLVHGDGKQEMVVDLEAQTLYTHRMTIRKGWFSDAQVVR